MDAEEQLLYVVGRRTGIFARLADMDDPKLRAAAEQRRAAHRVTLDNIDAFTAEIMQGFI